MTTGRMAETPDPPYYAVIFTSVRQGGDDGYDQMAEAMEELASQQPGFLGIESARGEDGLGITVSYWDSPEAIHRWRQESEHRVAQRLGRSQWYQDFFLRVAKVERAYGK